MQLPYSEELNIGYLSKLFENTTNCYKFFWFQAILRKMDGVRSRFTFDELINEMIADAWYMVTEYHLRLGPLGITDNLEEVVKYIHEKYGFAPAEKREKILEFLQEVEDKRIIKYKSDLTLNVPYRLQVPFYDEINIARSMWNGSKKILISEINRQKRLIYYFARISGLRTIIEVDEVWAEYLLKHKEILKGWTQLKLIQYLQNKNPSVPGIADKIEAPISRDIERVRKYWELIVQIDPSLRDIYGDILLKDEKISVDHFVPWQYVAHMFKAEYDERRRLQEVLTQIFGTTAFADKLSEIQEVLEHGDSKKVIYLDSLHRFGRKQGLEIYDRLKPVLHQQA